MVVGPAQGEELLPTLYEHYTLGGVTSGLVPTSNGFLLNRKPFKIVSGAIHYFRVHPANWRDRLRKLRAAGLTAVETWVNLLVINILKQNVKAKILGMWLGICMSPKRMCSTLGKEAMICQFFWIYSCSFK
jgi:hypothetical protein